MSRPSVFACCLSVTCALASHADAAEGSPTDAALWESVDEVFSELPDFGHTITIDQLMHHTSGLRDQWEMMAGWRMDDVIMPQQTLSVVSRQRELNFEPGSEQTSCCRSESQGIDHECPG